jgi:predicted alpha/beta-hydrolase family hydrolase
MAEAELARPAASPIGLLVLGHGAGGSIEAPDLRAVSSAALVAGFAVARVRQPYLVAGRRAPAPAAQLDIAWTAAVEHLGVLLRPQLPELRVAVGGRSSGARVACRTAGATGAVGILALAFPLHPPGHPEKSRAPELEVPVPLLVLQGARDPFGGPDQFPAGVAVHEVSGADHRLAGPALAVAVSVAVDWLVAIVASG